MSEVVVSGMRPTGPIHLGNYFGALKTWLELQDEHDCYFFIADWHALTTGFQDTSDIKEYGINMVIDWVAAGLDPEKCVIFRQSDVPEHAELHLLLEMITPEGWLKRNPTYKDQQDELGDNKTNNVGFLSYPVLQTADVLAYEATRVPVGEDQVPHIEIARKIVRRFNHLYDADFSEMEPLLKDSPKLLGLDGRKMSKSYRNCIYLSDSPEERAEKLMGAKTDSGPEPGSEVPEEGPVANLFRFLELFGAEEKAEEYAEQYRAGEIMYGYMKQDLGEAINDYFSEFDEKRRQLENQPDRVETILSSGRKQARKKAGETLEKVRNRIGLR